MKVSRRDFLILTTSFVAGCSSVEDGNGPAPGSGEVINAGPVSHYAAEGIYGDFRTRGFFIVRQGERLFAISAICTHKKCKLKAEPDHSFYCPCHGSTFDPNGHVTEGPAKRDLPVFKTSVTENGQLLVTL